MRPSIFIVILLVATCCVSAAAPFSKSIEATAGTYAADNHEIVVPSQPAPRQTPVTIEDRLLKIEKRQKEIMSQQAVISNRLDAIIDHVEESPDGH